MVRATKSYVAYARTGGRLHAVTEIGFRFGTDEPMWAQTACGRVIQHGKGWITASTNPLASVSCRTCQSVTALVAPDEIHVKVVPA